VLIPNTASEHHIKQVGVIGQDAVIGGKWLLEINFPAYKPDLLTDHFAVQPETVQAVGIADQASASVAAGTEIGMVHQGTNITVQKIWFVVAFDGRRHVTQDIRPRKAITSIEKTDVTSRSVRNALIHCIVDTCIRCNDDANPQLGQSFCCAVG
jgi:hypothetical protein